MLKTRYSHILIIIFFIIVIFTFTIPVSYASQYGSIHGKVLDRNGNAISNVTIVIQDGECRPIGSTLSNADGTFNYDQVAVEGGSGTFRIYASIDNPDAQATAVTSFVMVYPLKVTTQDVTFYNYPLSGIGTLYGVISSNENLIEETGGVVYINNGMYTIYEGNKYGQWSFTLPAGNYVIWCEHNKNLTTYKSRNYSVHVPSDDYAYQFIYMPMKEQTPYHVQPGVQRNIIYGHVTQKNGQPLSGATVELYKYSGNGMEIVDSTRSNSTGEYSFFNVNVRTVSEKYVVRATWVLNGETKEQFSAPFDVYYANTVGKKHEYDIPVSMAIVSTGNLNIRTTPQGAHIFIDGSDTGKLTPCTITDITAGQHSVTLALDGYNNNTSVVSILSEKTLNMNRTLDSNTGTLYLSAKPGDAKIYLNDKYAGTGIVSLPKAPAGNYAYKVVCDGYQEESGSFDLIPGRQVNKSFDLVAIPALNFIYISYLLNNMIGSLTSIF